MSPRESLPRGVWLMASALWGVFLAGMYLSDSLELFQARPYFYFTAVAGVLLVLLALKMALWPSRTVHSCGHAHGHGESCPMHHDEKEDPECGLQGMASERPGHVHPADHSSMTSLLSGVALLVFLMVPILAGFLVPHRALLSVAAVKRMGSELDSSAILGTLQREQRQWQRGAKDYQVATPLDVLEIGEQSPGLKVRTLGFVMKSTGLPEDVVRVARFRMTCCAADALPIAVLVRGDQARRFKSDTWIEVRGTVERQMIAGRELTVIVVPPDTKDGKFIMEVAAPANPYI